MELNKRLIQPSSWSVSQIFKNDTTDCISLISNIEILSKEHNCFLNASTHQTLLYFRVFHLSPPYCNPEPHPAPAGHLRQEYQFKDNIQKWTHHLPTPFFCLSPVLANGSLSALRKTLPTLLCGRGGGMKAESTKSVRKVVTVWFIFLDTCNVSDCRRGVHVCVCVFLSISLLWQWKESLVIAVFN